MPWSKPSGEKSPDTTAQTQSSGIVAGDARTVYTVEKTALTPASSTADNMVRIDAITRSGCPLVSNIERPTEGVSDTPQLWTVHTCHGDLVYQVMTKQGPDGQVVTVLPAGGAIDKPANPHFTPGTRGDEMDKGTSAAEPASDSAASSDDSNEQKPDTPQPDTPTQ
ncbi:hypothetical protein [Pararobbsia alpina]|nr:hypothetical protein [Pararobbsia alpina]